MNIHEEKQADIVNQTLKSKVVKDVLDKIIKPFIQPTKEQIKKEYWQAFYEKLYSNEYRAIKDRLQYTKYQEIEDRLRYAKGEQADFYSNQLSKMRRFYGVPSLESLVINSMDEAADWLSSIYYELTGSNSIFTGEITDAANNLTNKYLKELIDTQFAKSMSFSVYQEFQKNSDMLHRYAIKACRYFPSLYRELYHLQNS